MTAAELIEAVKMAGGVLKVEGDNVIGHVIPDPDWMLVFGQNRAI